jgi:hypothetical protein
VDKSIDVSEKEAEGAERRGEEGGKKQDAETGYTDHSQEKEMEEANQIYSRFFSIFSVPSAS